MPLPTERLVRNQQTMASCRDVSCARRQWRKSGAANDDAVEGDGDS
jgi:hypothetical protein